MILQVFVSLLSLLPKTVITSDAHCQHVQPGRGTSNSTASLLYQNDLIASGEVAHLTNMKVWVPALRPLPKVKSCAAPVICHVAAGAVMLSTNSST